MKRGMRVVRNWNYFGRRAAQRKGPFRFEHKAKVIVWRFRRINDNWLTEKAGAV